VRHVFQNPIDGVLVKDTEVAIGEDVVLQRLQFQAEFVGKIMNGDGAEIRQAGARADGGVFGDRDGDLVAPVLVRPGFDGGEFSVDTSAGVFGSVSGFLRRRLLRFPLA